MTRGNQTIRSQFQYLAQITFNRTSRPFRLCGRRDTLRALRYCYLAWILSMLKEL
jgi:hypothetical protein